MKQYFVIFHPKYDEDEKIGRTLCVRAPSDINPENVITDDTIPDTVLRAYAGRYAIWCAENAMPGYTIRCKDEIKQGPITYKVKPVLFFTDDETDCILRDHHFTSIMDVLLTDHPKHLSRNEARAYKQFHGYSKSEEYTTILTALMTALRIKGRPDEVKHRILNGIIERQIPIQAVLLYVNRNMYTLNPYSQKPDLHLKFCDTLHLGTQNKSLHCQVVLHEYGAPRDVLVTSRNVNAWQAAAPNGILIGNVQNKLYVSIDPDQFHISLPDYYKHDPSGDAWHNDAIELQVTPNKFACEPDVIKNAYTFTVIADHTLMNQHLFDRLLQKAGFKQYLGHYVPNDMPDWTFDLQTNTKISFRPDGIVTVRFPSGMIMAYPAIFLLKNYPGKCLNASLTLDNDQKLIHVALHL